MTIEELKKEYKKIFYLPDDGVLDVTISSVLSTYLKRDPVWLLIVGPSSGGKTELINIFTSLNFVFEVDELTESTFLSGMRMQGNKSPSLLDQIGNVGCIVMKDFTSVLTMRQEKREAIQSQLRQIYDGKFNKKTGNGENPSWVGKINFLGGVTDAVYTVGEQSADMGRRTINYVLPHQDRQITASYARRNKEEGNMGSKRDYLKMLTTEFILEKMEQLPDSLPKLDPELMSEISLLSDFVAQARTPVKRNFRGEIIMVDDHEMPMRIDEQVQVVAQMMQWLYDGKLTDIQRKTIYKLCLDCIPKQRRIALRNLAKYESVTTIGLATEINYPTETAKIWLEDLNAVEIVNRKIVKSHANKWILPEPFKGIMIKYDNIAPETGKSLDSEDDGTDYGFEEMDPGMMLEIQKNKEAEANAFFDSL
jgi:hypothetical protein